jgi:hypothetical protein
VLVITRDNFFHFFSNSKIMQTQLSLFGGFWSGIFLSAALGSVLILQFHFGYDFSLFWAKNARMNQNEAKMVPLCGYL